MKLKKFLVLALAAACTASLSACAPSTAAPDRAPSSDVVDATTTPPAEEKPSGNAPNVYPAPSDEDADNANGEDNTAQSNDVVKLTWSAAYNSSVHIVNFGLSPSSETVSFDFGYDTVLLKGEGYTTLDFTLDFDAYIDTGINVGTTINAYLTDDNDDQFGVGWSFIRFTNTAPISKSYAKSVHIEDLLQQRGKIHLTFEAVTNTLFTGTYISNINLTVTAH
ncbi:MAG: hypothetical protein J1G04_02535 [Clostridiales bacterium]|nr:hypothetical protein [Clostridiales bacterium]